MMLGDADGPRAPATVEAWRPSPVTREDVAREIFQELRTFAAEGGALRVALSRTLREELRELVRVEVSSGSEAPAGERRPSWISSAGIVQVGGPARGEDAAKGPYVIAVNGEAVAAQPAGATEGHTGSQGSEHRKRPPRMTERCSTGSWDDDIDHRVRFRRSPVADEAPSPRACPSPRVSNLGMPQAMTTRHSTVTTANTHGLAATATAESADRHEWAHRHIKGYTVASEEQGMAKQSRKKKRARTPGSAELAAARFAIGGAGPVPPKGLKRKGSSVTDSTEVVVIDSPHQSDFAPRLSTASSCLASRASRVTGDSSKNTDTDNESQDSDEIPPYKPYEKARDKRWKGSRLANPGHASTMDLRNALTDDSYTFREKLLFLVCSQWFDYVTGAFIVMNALTLGIQTDYMARNIDLLSPPLALRAIEICLCAFFTLEILLRLFVFRVDFFRMSGWAWNIFDMLLVFMQLVDELATFIVMRTADPTGESSVLADLTVMRIFRLFRLVRIVRLVRVMRMIGELRTLVMSIAGSMKSLLWAVFLLLLVIYIVGVYITQTVSDYRTARLSSGVAVNEHLTYYYCDLGRTMLSMYQSVTGGVDWDIAVTPLMRDVSASLGFVYTFYIAFVTLAMMNVVTGVFTETAILSAKRDKDVYMVNHVKELFNQLDLDDSGMISWRQIEVQLETSEIQEYFKAIDVDVSEAQALFRLLDLNDSGVISADDFLNGCIRIRGPARALETMLLLRETTRLAERQSMHATRMEQMLADIDNHILR